jgi:hypothetical protein
MGACFIFYIYVIEVWVKKGGKIFSSRKFFPPIPTLKKMAPYIAVFIYLVPHQLAPTTYLIPPTFSNPSCHPPATTAFLDLAAADRLPRPRRRRPPSSTSLAWYVSASPYLSSATHKPPPMRLTEHSAREDLRRRQHQSLQPPLSHRQVHQSRTQIP